MELTLEDRPGRVYRVTRLGMAWNKSSFEYHRDGYGWLVVRNWDIRERLFNKICELQK